MKAILALIDQTQAWRRDHKAHGRGIEAAACSIRIKALQDALVAVKGESQ